MPLGDKIGDQTVKDAGTALALDITELVAGLHGLLDRLDGATLKIVDGGLQINLKPWTPKA